jgi:hypothetical protein
MMSGRNTRQLSVSDPRPPAAAVPLTKGDTTILPLVRGRAAGGGRGSLTHFL